MKIDKQLILERFEELEGFKLEENAKTLPLALTAGLGAVGAAFKMANEDEHISSGGRNPTNLLKGVGSIANQLLGNK